MNHPTGHAAWFADIRHLLDVTQVTDGLPLPRIAPDRAVYFFTGCVHPEDAREAVGDAETALADALGVAFVPRRTRYGSADHYVLTAVLESGLQVDLVALAEHFGEAGRELAGVAA